MRAAKSGLIINITSGASGHTLPFMIPYFASKFGVETLPKVCKQNWRSSILKVFTIHLGFIQPK
jgi:NAD(P)-dependent dehydrogenase (short-subunit alcohol dehydrogenase family)